MCALSSRYVPIRLCWSLRRNAARELQRPSTHAYPRKFPHTHFTGQQSFRIRKGRHPGHVWLIRSVCSISTCLYILYRSCWRLVLCKGSYSCITSDANILEAVSEQAWKGRMSPLVCRAVRRVSDHMMASYIGLPRLSPSKAP